MPTSYFAENFLNFRKYQEKNDIKALSDSITFEPVVFEPMPKNIDLLYQLMPAFEEFKGIFDDDDDRPYSEWLDLVFQFIKSVNPWFCIVSVAGKPSGALWVPNWIKNGDQLHSAELSGVAVRGTPPITTMAAVHKFVSLVFNETEIRLIRSEFEASNRAARLCLIKTGFSNLEARRCLRFKGGIDIPGQLLSVTRPEWDALHERIE